MRWLRRRRTQDHGQVDSDLRYYAYVSATKIDMLYGQIPENERRRVATETKIDAKLASFAVRAEPGDETRFTRLPIVLAYLQRIEGIGSIDEPKRFFAGEMPMRWGDFDDDQEDMIYFGGVAGSVVVGLAGSRSNVIGKPTGVTGGFSSNGPAIWSALENAVRAGDSPNAATDEAVSEDETERMAADIVATTLNHQQGPLERLEFVAWRVFASLTADGTPTVLGTPLYVAYADERDGSAPGSSVDTPSLGS